MLGFQIHLPHFSTTVPSQGMAWLRHLAPHGFSAPPFTVLFYTSMDHNGPIIEAIVHTPHAPGQEGYMTT